MADEALLAGSRVMPAQLLSSGFVFRFPDLAAALEHTLR
jgi:NAD dependent epimerase/dehydratase family enzyme